VDGLTITVNDIANLATKDSFTLAPTANSASQIAVTLSSPSGLALASPVRTQAASSNTGSGTIALGSVFNNSAVNNNYAITIDANDPTKYTISPDSTVYTLTPSSNNTIYLPPGSSQANASYSVSLSGAPAKGDVYNLGFNSSSPTDNGNGLLMASIQTQNMFFGGTLSLSGNYNALTASIGATTGDAQSRSASANILNQQAVALQSSTSGVNLDEEAANLLSFQNAYKAAAQIVKTANDIMDTLLIAVGAP
jgi:flagellar hook-associated protein 1 FlgK